jgi:hypothetical protein
MMMTMVQEWIVSIHHLAHSPHSRTVLCVLACQISIRAFLAGSTRKFTTRPLTDIALFGRRRLRLKEERRANATTLGESMERS